MPNITAGPAHCVQTFGLPLTPVSVQRDGKHRTLNLDNTGDVEALLSTLP